LLYTRKAASAATKISVKPLAERCFAVFPGQLVGKASKIPQGIPAGIFKGFCAALAARCPRKPIGVRLPLA